MKWLMQTFGSSVMLLLAGCGAEFDTTFSCDQRAASAQICTDYENYGGDAVPLKDICTAQGGTIRTTLCSRTGVIGGCRLAGGDSVITNWVYSGSVSSIMQACSSNGGTFVTQ